MKNQLLIQNSYDEDRLGFTEISRVSISINDLSVFVKPKLSSRLWGKKKKFDDEHGRTIKILNSISCFIPSGSIMGILGASGSGKTSLLNVIANRMGSSSLSISGELAYIDFASSNPLSFDEINTAYVMQQDILIPVLTVRETLKYAADLRLSGATREQRYKQVEAIILELGLKECADTVVGDSMHKGISGGEKRRCSVGIQLLSNPSVLFLDEPTTGLDAFSAYQLIHSLKNLARKGRTIILSIHQPRSDIFQLFDFITLLSKGNTVYFGSVNEALPYFSKLGYDLPQFVNPADFLIDISAIDNRSIAAETEAKKRVSFLINQWKLNELKFQKQTFEKNPELIILSNSEKKSFNISFLREIEVLVMRGLKSTLRDPLGVTGLIMEAILMGIMCGWVFYQLDGSIRGIRSRMGAIYIVNSLQSYLILLYETYRLSHVDIKIYDRERSEGVVTVWGFLISRRIYKLVTEDFIIPLLFSVISYFMIGFRIDGSARYFFIFFCDIFLQHMCAIATATLSIAISRDFSKASLVGNLTITLQTMASGYFVNPKKMPVYVRWTKWISFWYYGVSVITSSQFTDYVGDCPYPGGKLNPQCVEYLGSVQLATLGIPKGWIGLPLGVISAFAVGFYIVSGIIFYFLKVDIEMSKTQKGINEEQGIQENLEKNEISSYESSRKNESYKISLYNITLKLKKYNYKFNYTELLLLNQISATFEPGKLNAILGPSGSGKSTLLNYLARRLKSSIFTRYYTISGEVMLNENKFEFAKKGTFLISYVTQEDDGLLASLTVRETLYFAAELRLPKSWSKERKHSRAKEIMYEMGLKDCADTIIGSEFLKGISGGEKRRVSISIQLLSDPRILLLDEPTSGLDAFTAASILEALRKLADNGRTVICTIHQPRSDMFKQIDQILLLSKGGKVAYNGSREKALNYFADIGYPCPNATNPSDHLIDLISTNLHSIAEEEVSKSRVQNLLDRWRVYQEGEQDLLKSDNIINQKGIGNEEENMANLRKQGSINQVLTILLRRSALNLKRRIDIVSARLMQVSGVAIIYLLFYTPIKNDLSSISDRLGLVQQFTSLYFVGMLNNVAAFPDERIVFDHEYDDGIYGCISFFLMYTIIEFPFEIISSFLFSALSVIATGLDRTATGFFVSFFISFGIINCGESIGIGFNSLFNHVGFAVNLISIVMSIGTVMSGIMSLQMMGFLKGVNYLSPMKFAIGAELQYTFRNIVIKCTNDELEQNYGICPIRSGKEALLQYGLTGNGKAFLGGVAVCIFVYRLVALFVLILSKFNFKVKRL